MHITLSPILWTQLYSLGLYCLFTVTKLGRDLHDNFAFTESGNILVRSLLSYNERQYFLVFSSPPSLEEHDGTQQRSGDRNSNLNMAAKGS